MYTYVFDDRENEVALNNIKAIIFDVITKEKAKQAVFREQVVNNADKKVQQDLLTLINEQDASLNDFIFLGNQLGEMLKKVDSYSRNFGLSNDNSYFLTQAVDTNAVVNQPVNNDLVTENVQVVQDTPNVSDNQNNNLNNTNDDNSKNTVSSIEVIPDEASNDVVESSTNYEAKSDLIATDEVSEKADIKDEPISENNSADNNENAEEEKKASVQLVIPGIKADDTSNNEGTKENTESVIPVNNEYDTSKLLIPVVYEKEEDEDISAVIDSTSAPSEESSDDEVDPMLDALLANDVKAEEEVKPTLTFKKRNNDLARAILTSGKQTASLRKSRDTQEALLNSRGFSVSTTGKSLEEQLVDNGLLPADNESQMENMLNQANELYAAGKVEEAQAMYDKISELNKQLQGGAKAA